MTEFSNTHQLFMFIFRHI